MIILLLILSLFVADVAGARDFWVSQSGSNSNGCTDTTTPQTTGAKLTLFAALDCLTQPGDTLHIRGGTWNEAIWTAEHSGMVSGNSSNPVTIKCHTGETCLLMPNASGFRPGTGGILTLSIGDNLSFYVIQDLIIDGSDINSISATNIAVGGSDNKFINVETRNNHKNRPDQWPGGGCTCGGDRTQWIGGSSHDNGVTADPYDSSDGAKAPYGFYWAAHNGLIDGAQIYNNGAFGIHNYSYATDPGGNIFRNNTFYGNGNHYYGSFESPPARSSSTILVMGSSTQVYNNLIRDNPLQEGISSQGNGCCTVITNNTIIRNNEGVHSDPGNVLIVKNNIVSNNNTNMAAPSASYTTNLCSSAGTGCAFNEPITTTFMNPTSDYRLKAGSGGIGKATDLSAFFTTDITGATRTQWDIGAYAFPVFFVTIDQPTSVGRIVTTNSTINLSGSSANSVTSCIWANDKGGSGSCFGTQPVWSINSIAIQPDQINTITVTVSNGTSQASASIKVAYSLPELVGAWSFDEGSGGTAQDSSGKGNHAQLHNTTWVTGRFGSALSFNGSSSSAVVPHNATLNIIGGYTIQAMVRPQALHTDFRQVAGNGTPQTLFTTSDTNYGCSNGPLAGYADTTTFHQVCNTQQIPITPTWTCLANTFDGTATRLFVNGVQVASTNSNALPASTTDVFHIGYSQYGEWFDGEIDNVRFWKYARSAAEISSDCNTAITGGAPPVPMALRFGAGIPFRAAASSNILRAK